MSKLSDFFAAFTGGVQSVTAGANITNSGTVANPVLDLDSAITGVSVNGVTPSIIAGTGVFLRGDGQYVSPSALGDIAVNVVVFTSGSSNHSISANVTVVQIMCVGGGGAGGSVSAAGNSEFGAGGGGGSGGHSMGWVTVTPGDIFDYTVGAGATTSGSDGVDSSVQQSSVDRLRATGGKGGENVVPSSSTAITAGGAGGDASGTLNIGSTSATPSGEPGGPGLAFGLHNSVSGRGGGNPMGAGGEGVFTASTQGSEHDNDGIDGGIGAGGSGAEVEEGEQASVGADGGNGGNGLVVFIEFKIS